VQPKRLPEPRTHRAPERRPPLVKVVYNHRNPAPEALTASEQLAAAVRAAYAAIGHTATSPPPRPRFAGPRRPPSVRHLVYHCYPRRGSWWPARIYALRDRLELFNGRRIIAVVTDETTDAAADVFDALAGHRFTHITLPNNRDRREGVTLVPLLECIEDLVGSEHATLWGHAKGVTRGDDAGVRRWTKTLETLLLDYWPVVEEQLTRKACVGAFKKLGAGWGPHESLSDWHYSGSWFWFRNDQLFPRDNWRWHDHWWGAAESYPSCHWTSDDAGTLFGLSEVPHMNLYKTDYWETHVEPDLVRFLERHREKGTKILRDRLNVGCGPFYAEGWWNTDFVHDDVVKPDQVVTPGRPFPFPDAAFTAAFAGHVLEHVWWDEVIPFLRELKRVVKRGGSVCVLGPDSKKVIEAAVRARDKKAAVSKVWEIIEDYQHHQVEMAHQDRTGLCHLWNCYESRVVDVMNGAGFKDVRAVDWDDDCLPGWPVVDYSNPDQFAVLGVVP
jgi:SAM-dependent methyltransferase